MRKQRRINMTTSLFGEVKVFRTIGANELSFVTDSEQKKKIVDSMRGSGFIPL
jgi:hypothetical protein